MSYHFKFGGEARGSRGTQVMKESLFAIRGLKYRSLEELKRKTVRISSFARIEREVLDVVGTQGLTELRMTTSRSELAGGLGKYGILDLEFEAAATLPDTDHAGKALLQDLYFIDNEEDEKTSRQGASDPTCISLLIEHLDNRKTFLKVFLRSDTPEGATRRLIDQARRDPDFERAGLVEKTVMRLIEEAEQRLPQDFEVEDACLTNSNYVWLHRHFWL